MPRVGLFGKRSSARKPDAVTKELVAFLSRAEGIESVTVVSGDEIELVATDREPCPVSLDAIRADLRGTSGLDRLERIESFVESAARAAVFQPVAAPVGHVAEPPPVAVPIDLAAAPPPVSSPMVPAPVAPANWADAAPAARPVVRCADDLDPGVVHWTIAGPLVLAVTVDDAFVTRDLVTGWDVHENAVAEAAIRWLIGHDPAVEPLGPGVRGWVPAAPRGHQAAWLTQPGLLLAGTGLDEAIAFAATSADVVLVDPADVALVEQIESATHGLFETGEATLAPDAFVVTPQAVRRR